MMYNFKNLGIHWELMSMYSAGRPTAVHIWSDLSPVLETCSWEDIFERIFSVTQESYLLSYHYQIVN